jgi:DUF3040 family protein
MLSDRERQELGLIEEGLRDDIRLPSSWPDGPRRRPPYLRVGLVRAAVVSGLAIALSGLVCGAAGLFFQGVLVAGVCAGWWLWRGKRIAARWHPSTGPEADPGRPR